MNTSKASDLAIPARDTQPNYELAEQFLDWLDPKVSTFTFQTFPEGARAALPSTPTGRIVDLWPDLVHDNRRGNGIAITINEIRDSAHSRTGADVVRVRAVWLDDDNGRVDAHALPLSPSIIVESSPGKKHLYWLVDGDWSADEHGRDDFRRVMQGLVSLGHDAQAVDISRVMRLPGSIHQKAEPHLVAIPRPIEGEPIRYTRKQIIEAFATDMPCRSKVIVEAHRDIDIDAELERVRSALEFIPSEDRGMWLRVGMALHHLTGGREIGLGVWDNWSRTTTATNYRHDELVRQWRAFDTLHRYPVTVATIYQMARDNGWPDAPCIDLPEQSSRPVQRFHKVHEPDGLTEITMANVREKFAGYGHQPSDEQFDGLEQIALCIEAMADSATGTMVGIDGQRESLASKYLVSFLPPGTGKTTVVVEAVKQLCQMERFADIGVLVLLSRLEEIKKLAEAMDLANDDFAVIVSEGKPENILGRQDDKTKAKVLFTTQEGLRTRGKDGTLFADMDRLYFNGQPRRVRIWDEAIQPSRTLTVGRYDLGSMLKPLAKSDQLDLAEKVDAFAYELKGQPDNAIVRVPDLSGFGVSIEDARAWVSSDTKDAIEALFKLSGKEVRLRHSNGEHILDYEDILPDDLAPLLTLDASGELRETYSFWHDSRKGLVFLPSPGKRYDGLTIHHWDRGAGRKAQKKDGLVIAQGVADTINSIPEGDEVLVVHFLPNKYAPDMGALVSGLVKPGRKVRYLTWGKHTATNDFHNAKHVILAGILQYSVPENEAVGRGAKGIGVNELLSEGEFLGTRLGEIAHNIFQAACRGHVRHSVDGTCPEGCHLYMVFSSANREGGIPVDLLSRIFPGSTVEDWKPVYELTGKKKKLAGLLEWRIGDVPIAELIKSCDYTRADNLKRDLSHPDLVGYLESSGVLVNIGKSVVAVSRDGLALSIDSVEYTTEEEWVPL